MTRRNQPGDSKQDHSRSFDGALNRSSTSRRTGGRTLDGASSIETAADAAIVSFAADPNADMDGSPSEPALLTLSEIARVLRVSERTVRRRIADGTLHKVQMHGRLVRISLDELRRITSGTS